MRRPASRVNARSCTRWTGRRGCIIGKDGKFGFNNAATATALQRFADLSLVHKVTPPDFGSMKDSDVKGGFTNKQLAMIVDATDSGTLTIDPPEGLLE